MEEGPAPWAEPQRPAGCRPVDEAEEPINTYGDFQERCRARDAASSEPLLIRRARLSTGPAYSVQHLRQRHGELRLPGKSIGAGARGGVFVGEQGGRRSVSPSAQGFHPRHAGLGEFLAQHVLQESELYLRVSSPQAAYVREVGRGRLARRPAKQEALEVLQALAADAPLPRLLPCDRPLALEVCLGSQGSSFGPRRELCTGQFLLQSQGCYELWLLGPRVCEDLAPTPTLGLGGFQVSRRGEGLSRGRRTRHCLWALLQPGDLIFIPAMWWHEGRAVSPGPSLSTAYFLETKAARKYAEAARALSALQQQLLQKGAKGLHVRRHVQHFFMGGIRNLGQLRVDQQQLRQAALEEEDAEGDGAPSGAESGEED